MPALGFNVFKGCARMHGDMFANGAKTAALTEACKRIKGNVRMNKLSVFRLESSNKPFS